MVNTINVLLMVWLCGVATAQNPMHALVKNLMTGYKAIMRPVVNHTTPTIVMIQLSLHQLRELNAKLQVLTANIWVDLRWDDEFLKWNPKDYQGVMEIHLPSSNIWRPDIVLSNSVDEERASIHLLSDTMVTIKHDGKVSWSTPALFKSTCRLNVKNYPFDLQTCPLVFGSWSRHRGALILRPVTSTVPITEYLRNENGEWDVKGMQCRAYSRRFSGFKEIFTYVTFFVIMQRRPLFYIFHLAVPIAMFMAIGATVFIVPPASGEKVDLAITLLLSMTFFMLVLMDNIPPSSDVISLFAYFIGGVIALLSTAAYLSVIVTFVFFKGVRGQPPPRWLKFIVLRVLAKIIGVGEDSYWSFLCRFWKRRPTKEELTFSESTSDVDTQVPNLYSSTASADVSPATSVTSSSPATTAGSNGILNNRRNVTAQNSNVSENNGALRDGEVRWLDGGNINNSTNTAVNAGTSPATSDLLLADMVDMLIDVLEEMRMMRVGTSNERLADHRQELVTAEWHDVAMVLDRACFIGYSILNIAFATVIYGRRPGEVGMSEVRLPEKM